MDHESSSDRLRRFIQFLLDRDYLTRPQLAKVARFRSMIDTRVAFLCSLQGYISLREAYALLADQVNSGKRFGELAVEKGLLAQEQVNEVLQLAHDKFLMFQECLVATSTIDRDALLPVLQEFEEEAQSVEVRVDKEIPEPVQGSLSELDEIPDTISDGRLRAALRRVKQFATVPKVVERALQLLNDPNVKLEAVEDALLSDPALCAQILRLVNSAFFGVRSEVSTISRAVVTLGLKAVRQVVSATLVIRRFKELPEEKIRETWWHTVLTSQWSRALAELRRDVGAEVAAVAGLVHDVGVPVLLQSFPESMAAVERMIDQGIALPEAEKRAFGMTHAEVGSFLCHFWAFPDPLIQAVHHHHTPLPILQSLHDLEPLTRIVGAACALSSLVAETPQLGNLRSLSEEFVQFHGLSIEKLEALAPDVFQEAHRLAAFLS